MRPGQLHAESIRDAFVNTINPMKKLIFSLLLIYCALSTSAQTTVTFDWSKPGSLKPAYPAPDADNRYGEYISNVDFTAGGVTFTVKDDAVKEQSQRARFLFGYNTQMVEMRAYLNSDIVITAPDNMVITAVKFEGAKVDENYLEPYDEEATFKNGSFTPSTPTGEVKFYVAATINCTATYVTISENAAVTDLQACEQTAGLEYYNLQGVRIARPDHGIAIERRGSKSCLVRF